MREQDPKVRVTNFEEVCQGYTLEEAQLEASRCLHCRKPRCVEHCPVSPITEGQSVSAIKNCENLTER